MSNGQSAPAPNKPTPAPDKQTAGSKWPQYGISGLITAAALVLLSLKGFFSPDVKLSEATTIGLLIVAALPWLSHLVASIKGPGGWEIVFRQHEQKIGQLEEKETHQREAIKLTLNALERLTPNIGMKSLAADPAKEFAKALAEARQAIGQ